MNQTEWIVLICYVCASCVMLGLYYKYRDTDDEEVGALIFIFGPIVGAIILIAVPFWLMYKGVIRICRVLKGQ